MAQQLASNQAPCSSDHLPQKVAVPKVSAHFSDGSTFSSSQHQTKSWSDTHISQRPKKLHKKTCFGRHHQPKHRGSDVLHQEASSYSVYCAGFSKVLSEEQLNQLLSS